MPATSTTQAHFMRMVAAYKKHKAMPEGLSATTQDKIKKAAASMSMAEVTHFMHTKKKAR